MTERLVDLCVIGAGSAGLSVAATAALLGVHAVLIERDRMGGECRLCPVKVIAGGGQVSS